MLGGSSVKTMRHARPRRRAISLRATKRPKQRRWPRRLAIVLVAVLVAAAVGAGIQWFSGVPKPKLAWSAPATARLAGSSPVLPLPATGESLVSVQGLGTVASKNADQQVPIASITKVMTAYVILHDHPLGAGASGPLIPVTAADVALYKAEAAGGQSTETVTAGETLTELDALEGLLIPSANNLADLLARWDAGSDPAFVAKMNSTAQALGMTGTHFADPSGLNPASVSTASDLVLLGQAAMGNPTFTQIVAMPQYTPPGGSVVYNYDYDLGHDGIIGIKTGSDAAAGGCFLFEARQPIAGRTVTIVGDVLGQKGASMIAAVLTAAENEVKAAAATLGTFTAVPAGEAVGKVTTPWGSSSTVVTSSPVRFFGWPGMLVKIHLLPGTIKGSLPAGAGIGTLDLTTAGQTASVGLHLSRAVTRPGPGWKLTRI